MNIGNELLDKINISTEEKVEAIEGIAYLMRHIGAVLLMCDVKDLGVGLQDNQTKAEIYGPSIRKLAAAGELPFPNQFEPNIYIYDSYPNGIGFSEVLFEKSEEMLEKTLGLIEGCNCERGCPSCIGPPIRSNDNHKEAARFIIKLLLDRVYA
jgi:DEAD/DEAH box helicase domain-containing protein